MDYAACNVVYVDRTAREDKLIRRDDATLTASFIDASNHVQDHAPGPQAPDAVHSNLQTLLGTFSEGSCRTLFFSTKTPG
jgi:3',5'-cyclic-nucleotide phosphodiesterase